MQAFITTKHKIYPAPKAAPGLRDGRPNFKQLLILRLSAFGCRLLPFSRKNYIIQESFAYWIKMKFLSDFRALLIGLWLGAACFFSFAVAPSAFAVLENNREAAGSIVSRTLMIVNLSGLVVGLILLASSFIKRREIKPLRLWTERFLLLIVTAACAVGQFVIALWMTFIRAQIGKPIDEAAADDPLKIQFDNLHQYSIWILSGAMIAALIAFFLMTRKSENNQAVEKKDEFKF